MSARRPLAAAALALLAAAQSVRAASSWKISAPGDALSVSTNNAAPVVGPVSFTGCDAIYVGAVIDWQTNTTTYNQVYATAGSDVGQWKQIGNLTKFGLNSGWQEQAFDADAGRLFVWGPGVVNVGVPSIPWHLDDGQGTSNDSTNGAGQLWASSDGLLWTQLLAAGNAYNRGVAKCFFRGSIYTFDSSPPLYADWARALDQTLLDDFTGNHYRYTPDLGNAWLDITANITGLPPYSQVTACTVTADGSTLLVIINRNNPQNLTVYATTDGLSFSSRPVAPWSDRFVDRLVTVGSDILMVGGLSAGEENSTFAETYLPDTWSTADAGQSWTLTASSFGGDDVFFGNNVGSVMVLDNQLYVDLVNINPDAQVLTSNNNSLVLATLGSAFDFDQATCLRTVAAAKDGLHTNTTASFHSAGAASQPAMYAAALAAGLAMLLL